MAFMEIHDSSKTDSLSACINNLESGPQYKYQAEQWVLETKSNDGGEDGPLTRWDLRAGSQENPGPVLYRWERQPDGEVIEVSVT